MATLAPVHRQPLGAISSDRLMALQSKKNLQNAIPINNLGKRSIDSDKYGGSDEENVEPALPVKSMKRQKGSDGVKHATTKTHATISKHLGPLDHEMKMDISQTARKIKIPSSRLAKLKSSLSSPPTVPKNKPSITSSRYLLNPGRRSSTASPFTRVNPPKSLSGTPSLSIDAALSGTFARPQKHALAEKEVVQSLDDCPKPKGWFFEIREDTLDETLTNVMEHSTNTLDISDDEDSRKAKNDRGKENVPPSDTQSTNFGGATTAPASIASAAKPKKRMAKNPFYRAPLGDLDVSELYEEAPFLGKTSEPEDKLFDKSTTPKKPQAKGQWPLGDAAFPGFGKTDGQSESFDIWESPSAKSNKGDS